MTRPTTLPDPTPRSARDHERPVRVLVMTGSTREGRFGPVPARWAAEHARLRDDIDVDVADLADLDLPTVMNDHGAHPALASLGGQLHAADAVVIVTPVYNRGYPASLKNAIDWFHDEWAATPIGFVSYGGRTGGIEAVEQLRTVFVELGTMTIRNVLTFPDYPDHFHDDGTPTAPDALAGAAAGFFDQLLWWARALRDAKAGHS
ncbi:NADPH-dependent oxidoreductase [Rhodococcus rhodnii]|nr:NAD(P)H-dependent oxidoreductase [Rhodococcus rhodnii]TXG91466.1 NADPH-dependent oxidoreductase [Rhodococcus rhodnii]